MPSPDAIATTLLEARRARRSLGTLPAEAKPASEPEAYAAQLALARQLGALPPGGFKIGATAAKMQELLGVSGPAAGFMPAGGIERSGVRLRHADMQRPGVECEIAVRMGKDLPPPGATPYKREQVADAVGSVFAAIEVVDNRYGDLKAVGTPTLIADQFFHVGAVLGADAPGWPGLDLGALKGEITINGKSHGGGKGSDLMGHPLECVRWLANSPAAAAFGGLRIGQVVLCGSVVPPQWLEGPSEVAIAFDILGEVKVSIG